MKKSSIIVPVYNEEKTIKELLKKVKNLKIPMKKEIIVIDDGSRDNSLKILKSFKNINLISHQKNKGKGAAIKTGLKSSKGDIVIIQDADLECDPKQIPFIIRPILENRAEIVYGSRFLMKNNQKWRIPLYSRIGNKIISFLARRLYNCNLTDVETCYKAFTKKVKNSLNLTSNDFGFEIEFTAQVCKKGFEIKELPIEYHPRPKKEGKKLSIKDGAKALIYLFKFRRIK